MQRSIEGQVAWVTGAGSGIGQAGAIALAGAGATVVLSGRRTEPLEGTAQEIRGRGGRALVAAADVSRPDEVAAVRDRISKEFGRCDILVNNAGMNIPNRRWSEVDSASFDAVVGANLSGSFYAVAAVLPMMRQQRDGLLIHVSSWAGRRVSLLSGPAYVAAKHAVVAMSESLNQEECVNGIRSCCLCPGEVATPILDKRPVPVSEEDRGRMLQPEDLAEAILFVARMPPSVCINEVLLSPTWNRGYVAALGLGPGRER
jgi:NADP-dependent 3-hydroxy acid dehydrogenase YdfG